MKARATIKTDYYGHTLIRVNLKGRGTDDIENKVTMLAALYDAEYWEVEFRKEYTDPLAFQMTVNYKNQIITRRRYTQ